MPLEVTLIFKVTSECHPRHSTNNEGFSSVKGDRLYSGRSRLPTPSKSLGAYSLPILPNCPAPDNSAVRAMATTANSYQSNLSISSKNLQTEEIMVECYYWGYLRNSSAIHKIRALQTKIVYWYWDPIMPSFIQYVRILYLIWDRDLNPKANWPTRQQIIFKCDEWAWRWRMPMLTLWQRCWIDIRDHA